MPTARRFLTILPLVLMSACLVACGSQAPPPLPQGSDPVSSEAAEGRVDVPAGNDGLEIQIDGAAVSPIDAAASPDAPVFQSGVGQGEGIPVFRVLSAGVALHQAPIATSAIVGPLGITPGEAVPYSEVRQHTLDPGLVRAEVDIALSGRDFGPVDFVSREAYEDEGTPEISVQLTASKTLEYLMDRAEGSCFLSINGHVIEADTCPAPPDFTRALEPATERWILVIAADGSPAGWARVATGSLEETDRVFEE